MYAYAHEVVSECHNKLSVPLHYMLVQVFGDFVLVRGTAQPEREKKALRLPLWHLDGFEPVIQDSNLNKVELKFPSKR